MACHCVVGTAIHDPLGTPSANRKHTLNLSASSMMPSGCRIPWKSVSSCALRVCSPVALSSSSPPRSVRSESVPQWLLSSSSPLRPVRSPVAIFHMFLVAQVPGASHRGSPASSRRSGHTSSANAVHRGKGGGLRGSGISPMPRPSQVPLPSSFHLPHTSSHAPPHCAPPHSHATAMHISVIYIYLYKLYIIHKHIFSLRIHIYILQTGGLRGIMV